MAGEMEPGNDDHLRRVRRLCLAMPGTSEKLSHGAPSFFAGKKMFVMLVRNHHQDPRLAVWIAAAPGEQAQLIRNSPETYFNPPYVGVRGWVGIQLDRIDDEELGVHITEAFRCIQPKKTGRKRWQA